METAKHEVRYEVLSSVSEDGKYKAVRVGHGSFADVFRAKETLTSLGDNGPGKFIVAKIFKDENHANANTAFESERETLLKLGEHDYVVRLRGVEPRRPPTFVCGECGVVFQVHDCPECEDEQVDLINPQDIPSEEGHAFSSMARGVALVCRKRKHIFQKSLPPDSRLVASRPCGHKGDCDTVNFLFTYCIYLDHLDVNMTEYLGMLRDPSKQVRGRKVRTILDRDKYPTKWTHETFLMRLQCLVNVAEALAYVHSKGILHGDIAPENIMISLSEPLHQGMPQKQVPRLIDLGQARPHEDPRHTTHIQARSIYAAPEIKVVNSVISNEARLEGLADLRTGAECFLICQASLAPGDSVSDTAQGSYTVTEEESPDSPVEHGLHAHALHERDNDISDLWPFDSDADPKEEAADEKEAERGPVSSLFSLRRERRYRLKINSVMKGPPEAVSFHFNQAVRVPADIYALGSVIAWLVSDGNIILLSGLQSEANAASNRHPPGIDTLPKEVLEAAAEAMPLLWKYPKKAKGRFFFEGICLDIVNVIVRCLVRGKGAYAEGRSWGHENAALKIAQDLKAIYEKLYFAHYHAADYVVMFQKSSSVVASLQSKFEQARAQLDIAEQGRRTAVLCAEQAEKALEEALTERDRAAGECAALRDKGAELREERAALQAHLDSVEREYAELKAIAKERAESAALSHSEHVKLVEDLQGRIKNLQQQLDTTAKNAKNALGAEKAEKEKLLKEVELLSPLKARCDALSLSNGELKGSLEAIRKKTAGAEEEAEALKKLNQDLTARINDMKRRGLSVAQQVFDDFTRLEDALRGVALPAGILPAPEPSQPEDDSLVVDVEWDDLDKDFYDAMEQRAKSTQSVARRIEKMLVAMRRSPERDTRTNGASA